MINKKLYIGQTNNLHNRWISHKSKAKNGASYAIYCAIRKHGIENFIFEEVFTVLKTKDIDELEIQFIAEYDSYNNGYNMTTGGNSNKEYSKELIKKLSGINNSHFKGYFHTPYGILNSATDIIKYTNKISSTTISRWCKNPTHIINKQSITKSEYLTEDMLGKNFRDIGFWFEALDKRNIGRVLKMSNKNHPALVGYWHTPFGKLNTIREIKKYTNRISPDTIRKWCKDPNKIISKTSVTLSKYLTEDMLGKTYREIGFWFDHKTQKL